MWVDSFEVRLHWALYLESQLEQKCEYSFSLKLTTLLGHHYTLFPPEADLRKLVSVVSFGMFFRKVFEVVPSVSKASAVQKPSPFSGYAGSDMTGASVCPRLPGLEEVSP